MLFTGIFCILLKIEYIYSIAYNREVNGLIDKGLMGKIYKVILKRANNIIAQNKDQIKYLNQWLKKIPNTFLYIINISGI
jgi:hypothetical protein